jgi:glycosyltransferase involved in cell wall biosynthesis
MARIGIHATALEPGRTGGAETYLRQLLTAPAFRQALAGHEVLVFAGEPTDPAVLASGFEVVRCPIDPHRRNTRIVWDQVALPALLRRHRLDLVHFPYSSICRTYDGPQVVTVHDSINFVMPEAVSRVERIYRRLLQGRLAANPRCQVIAVSDTDRRLLCQHLRLPDERTTFVYHGRPGAFDLPAEQVGRPRDSAEILWVGRPYLHKNVETLIRGFAAIPPLAGGRLPSLRAVGFGVAEAAGPARLAAQLGVADRVLLEPARPHHELPALFQAAALFLFPSRVESFGLPTLEAQSAGLPVVCSDLPILREILGDGALFANPDDPTAFASHAHALLSDPIRWAAQARRGHALAARYSWDRCARETAAVYEATLARFMRR